MRTSTTVRGCTGVALRWCAAALAAGALSVSADAQDDVMAHYDAYEQALVEGRTGDAIAAVEAAWRAAEATWGDRAETGVLAFNLAALLVRAGESARAVESAERALALSLAGVADAVPVQDASLLLGLAEYHRSGGAQGAGRIATALDGRTETPSAFDDVVVLGGLLAADVARAQRDWPLVQRRAEAALLASLRLEPEYRSYAVDAALFVTRAVIETEDYDAGLAALGAAIRTFPTAARPTDDADLARLIAWEAMVWAIMGTEHARERHVESELRVRLGAFASVESAVLARSDASSECFTWTRRTRPSFPSDEILRGRYGAVVMAFDVSRNGRAENRRVLATAPEEMTTHFSVAIHRAMSDWRASVEPDATDECLRDRTAVFRFEFP
jgi:tetratricopeptide (TPR) repeat protein